jgi:hypothetical protein
LGSHCEATRHAAKATRRGTWFFFFARARARPPPPNLRRLVTTFASYNKRLYEAIFFPFFFLLVLISTLRGRMRPAPRREWQFFFNFSRITLLKCEKKKRYIYLSFAVPRARCDVSSTVFFPQKNVGSSPPPPPPRRLSRHLRITIFFQFFANNL